MAGEDDSLLAVPDEGLKEIAMSDALYRAVCGRCGSDFAWELNPDPDGPSWSASCCGNLFYMYPTSVAIEVEDDEDYEPDDLD